jgi:hypothetical protein
LHTSRDPQDWRSSYVNKTTWVPSLSIWLFTQFYIYLTINAIAFVGSSELLHDRGNIQFLMFFWLPLTFFSEQGC